MRTVRMSISLSEWIVEEIENLAEEVEASKSEVIEDILSYVLENEELLNEIFPYEEEVEEEEEEE